MPHCVFDIETAPLPDADIPPALVDKLKEAEPEDDKWKEMLGLYALSAQVVCIGMLNGPLDEFVGGGAGHHDGSGTGDRAGRTLLQP